jgi:hypothetical protein
MLRPSSDTQTMIEMPDRPQDVGTGGLFKNDKKEKSTHPDYRGDCEIHGKPFWISAWIKEGKDGKKFMSLAFRVKDEPAKPKPTASRFDTPIDDQIPF